MPAPHGAIVEVARSREMLARCLAESEANALELVDLMLHFGLPDHAVFLLTYAVQVGC